MSREFIGGKELTDRILALAESEVGKRTREAPSSVNLRTGLSQGTVNPQEISEIWMNLSGYIAGITEIAHKTEICSYQLKKGTCGEFPFPVHLYEDVYPSHLAISMFTHDLIDFISSFPFSSDYLQEGVREKNIDEINKSLSRDVIWNQYDIARLAFNLIPYIASGEDQYLRKVEVEELPRLLRAGITSSFIPKVTNNLKQDYILSDQFWCLKQCYKNADKIITKTGHEDNERFESPLTDIEITLENEEPYQVASIRNYARGIRYERLPKIFGRYTQGGTGLGLEVVKRLCELSNGFVVVKSAREDNKAHAHDTTNPVSYIEQLEGDFKRGTEFQMHFKI